MTQLIRNLLAISGMSFFMCVLLSTSQAAGPSTKLTLTVSTGRLVVCEAKGNTSTWTVDLPQDQSFDFWGTRLPRRERIISVWKTEKNNENQEFVLVPADADSVFICAKRSGAVIGVRQVKEEGKKTEIVGILQSDEPAPDKHAAVRWMIDR